MSEPPRSLYRCRAPARWLPRTLAAAVLVAGMLAAARLEAYAAVPGARAFRIALVVASAALALWIVRKGAEVRLRVSVGVDAVELEIGGRGASLPLEEIASVRYEPPFGPSRSWLPAAVLLDRHGASWRLSGLLDGGERALAEIVAQSGREDLAAWVAAQDLEAKMARHSLRVWLGYALALVVMIAAAAHYLR